MAAFTLTKRRLGQRKPHRGAGFQLQAQVTESTSVEGPDSLVTAFADDDEFNDNDATDQYVNGVPGAITNKIVRPPIENEAPKYILEPPPHSALAQVIANQYGIDLSSVKPSATGSKITAADVEYHAWKLSQPPCTSEALELAHSLNLNLNDLYDDEEREYVVQLSDVELFRENAASLQMVSQARRRTNGEEKNEPKSSRERRKKISALDKRMDKNLGILSQKALALAGSVAGGFISQTQQMQLKASERLRNAGMFVDISGEATDEINKVEDFDSDLAREIQEALSYANVEDRIATEPSGSCGESIEDVNVVDDIDADLAAEIQEALSSAANGDNSTMGLAAVDAEDSTAVESESSYSMEELQSLTVVKLKDKLRRLGMKVSGRKSELIDRLSGANNTAAESNKGSANKDKTENPLFFVTLEGTDW